MVKDQKFAKTNIGLYSKGNTNYDIRRRGKKYKGGSIPSYPSTPTSTDN